MRPCACSNSLGNTGQTNCQPLMQVAKKLILVPVYANDGTRNKIAVATALTAAAVTALINQADTSKRWYPTPDMENIGGERADSVFDEAPSGKKAFVKQGPRSMSFEIWDEGPEYKQQLDQARCNEFGIYIVDASGSLYGMVPATEDGYLYPIKVDKASWDARLVMPTETTTMKLAVSFNWNNNEDDALIRVIPSSDFSSSTPPDLLSIEGLLDTSITITSITTTTAKVHVFERFGSRLKKNKVKGLVIGDFVSSVTLTASKIRDTVGAADITLSSVAEETGTETTITGPGTYLLTWTPAQTTADTMQPYIVKTGFDGAGMLGTLALIP